MAITAVKIERLSKYADIGKLLLPLGPWPSVISASYDPSFTGIL